MYFDAQKGDLHAVQRWICKHFKAIQSPPLTPTAKPNKSLLLVPSPLNQKYAPPSLLRVSNTKLWSSFIITLKFKEIVVLKDDQMKAVHPSWLNYNHK